MIFEACFTRKHHTITLPKDAQTTHKVAPIVAIIPDKIPPIHLVCQQFHAESKGLLAKRVASHAVPRLIIYKDPHDVTLSSEYYDVAKDMVLLIDLLIAAPIRVREFLPSVALLIIGTDNLTLGARETRASFYRFCDIVGKYVRSSKQPLPVEITFVGGKIAQVEDTDMMRRLLYLIGEWERKCIGKPRLIKVFGLSDDRLPRAYSKTTHVVFGGVLGKEAWEREWT